MKKMIVLLLVCAFSTSVFAAWDVYDYRASFKRVNDTLRWFNLSSGRKKLDTASVVGDTFRGFLAIEQCAGCYGTMPNSFVLVETAPAADTNTRAIIYLVRGGEKVERASGKPIVIRSYANVDYAMFGPKATMDGVPAKLIGTPTLAWFTMEYDVAIDALINGRGFLGDANTNVGTADRARVAQAGFGAMRQTTTVYSCSEGSCLTMINASGSLVGQFDYTGICTAAFMMDVCATTSASATGVSYAPISGTWSLKYNKAVSSSVSGLTPAPAADPLFVAGPVVDVDFTNSSFDGEIIRRLTGVANAASAKVVNVKTAKADAAYFFQ